MNITKTKVMHFRRNTKAVVGSLRQANVCKYLGMHINEHLNWEQSLGIRYTLNPITYLKPSCLTSIYSHTAFQSFIHCSKNLPLIPYLSANLFHSRSLSTLSNAFLKSINQAASVPKCDLDATCSYGSRSAHHSRSLPVYLKYLLSK